MNIDVIKTLIEEVLTTARWDDTGVTVDLIEPALNAAVEIGMTQDELKALATQTR